MRFLLCEQELKNLLHFVDSSVYSITTIAVDIVRTSFMFCSFMPSNLLQLIAVWMCMLCWNCSVGCLIWMSSCGSRHVGISWRLRFRHFSLASHKHSVIALLCSRWYVRFIYHRGYHMSSLCLVPKVLLCSLIDSGFCLCSLRPMLKSHSCLLHLIDLLLSFIYSFSIIIDFECILVLL